MMKEYTVKARPGYMGSIAWDGNHSHQGLYGAELCKALREAFRKCGVKGVSVKKQTYSGGQSIYLTVTAKDGDIVSREDFVSNSRIEDFESATWIRDPENNNEYVQRDVALYEWDDAKKKRVAAILANQYYDSLDGKQLNQYRFGKYREFTAQFLAKLQTIHQIVSSFNHDDSNAMVDYFDRGFYEHYRLKIA